MLEGVELFKGVVLPYVNLLIFLSLGFYFLRKPLTDIAQKRKSDYLEAMKSATEAKELAEKKNEELQKRVESLELEIKEIIENARKVASLEVTRLEEESKRLSQHILEEAKRIGEGEVDRARKDIKSAIIAGVKESVTSTLAKGLSEEVHKTVLDKQLGKIGSIGGSV